MSTWIFKSMAQHARLYPSKNGIVASWVKTLDIWKTGYARAPRQPFFEVIMSTTIRCFNERKSKG